MQIHFIRTRYPHWGNYSGIHQFTKHLDPQAYKTETWLASDSDEDFPIKNKVIRAWLRHKLQERGMQWYKLSDLVAEFKAIQKAFSQQVDIIHYLDGEHSAQILPKLLKRFKKNRPKIIATYHQPPEILDTLIDKEVISQLDFITVVCPEQAAYFEKLVDSHKICSILHGIDTNYFKPSNFPKDSQKFRCLTVGRWLRDYNALRQVADKLISDVNIEFHIVSGNTSDIQDLDNVILHTGINDLELLSLYQQSDILFLPLKQSTANNALLEAIACGLPVISTDLPSVRAYLPGKESILVRDNDVKQLVEAILYLKNHPVEREAMGVASRKRAVELDWKNVSLLYSKSYSQLTSS